MDFRTLAAAAVFALSSIGATSATALDFKFSFENTANGGGTVTGIVRGLSEGTTAATSFEVLTNSLGFGIGEYIGSPINNSFTVTFGQLTSAFFASNGDDNTPPAVTSSSISVLNLAPGVFAAGLTDDPGGSFTPSAGNATFMPAATAAIPLPAGGALLLTGILALGWFRHRAST
ncbi:MAG: VPLPA-CTERM sorting domain-containing protein [Pseudomonadota bacterium]